MKKDKNIKIIVSKYLSIGKKRAVVGIIIGVIISACIVTVITILGSEIWLNFIENEAVGATGTGCCLSELTISDCN